ncbi:hypothetical protein PTET_b0397 [Pseudoalteromonas tetraodonis]|nr:hypothetical protein PTET_b0397 [Pseudoalteromonas tetraodonis]
MIKGGLLVTYVTSGQVNEMRCPKLSLHYSAYLLADIKPN